MLAHTTRARSGGKMMRSGRLPGEMEHVPVRRQRVGKLMG